jgi:hypothetical protein
VLVRQGVNTTAVYFRQHGEAKVILQPSGSSRQRRAEAVAAAQAVDDPTSPARKAAATVVDAHKQVRGLLERALKRPTHPLCPYPLCPYPLKRPSQEGPPPTA